VFIKKMSAVALALCVASVSAKGSDVQVPLDVKFQTARPCMVQVTPTHWANAVALETLWISDRVYNTEGSKYVKGVVWTFGRNVITMPSENPQAEIQRYLTLVKETCK
jgi:hypothetical protein